MPVLRCVCDGDTAVQIICFVALTEYAAPLGIKSFLGSGRVLRFMGYWLLCHVHAFDYFGGVPRLLIPDNAKTATITNNRYEVVLNRSYQELAEHYGTTIVPARVRKPDDKAAAEGSVKYVSTWITAALRDRTFFTLDEARRAVIEKLEELNRRPFKKREGLFWLNRV